MEPASDRREHVHTGRAHPPFACPPQWSPPVIGGSTGLPWTVPSYRVDAAMEPASDRREHGSDDLGPLTCTDRPSREWSVNGPCWVYSMDLSRCKICPLTCVRALPGFRVTISALAARLVIMLDAGWFLMESPARPG